MDSGPSERAVETASAVYEFGVMPGDESEATDEEVRRMALRTLAAAHDPRLGLDRSVCLRDVLVALTGTPGDPHYDARVVLHREFAGG